MPLEPPPIMHTSLTMVSYEAMTLAKGARESQKIAAQLTAEVVDNIVSVMGELKELTVLVFTSYVVATDRRLYMVVHVAPRLYHSEERRASSGLFLAGMIINWCGGTTEQDLELERYEEAEEKTNMACLTRTHRR